MKDIPFPDVLHVYDATLSGFETLSNNSGYFNVDEDQIGINEVGNVKVWLNPAFQSFQNYQKSQIN